MEVRYEEDTCTNLTFDVQEVWEKSWTWRFQCSRCAGIGSWSSRRKTVQLLS